MAGERDDDLRRRMRAFIDERVIPQEPVLARDDDASAAAIERLKEEAKAAGLWALGHPAEIGGGGVGLVLDSCTSTRASGAPSWGQFAVGSVSMQDAIMLHRFGTAGAAGALAAADGRAATSTRPSR